MSLKVFFEGVDSIPDSCVIERDVGLFFRTFSLDGCQYDELMLKNIERGEYVDEGNFVERFGKPLGIDCLSTGTKAALSLYHMPDVALWGGEVGSNALTEIVRHCDRGILVLPAKNYCIFCEDKDFVIDVECRGRRYTSLEDFSEYMMEDAPYDRFE